MSDTKLVGDISEHLVTVELLRKGFSVLVPVGDRLPYDRVVDFNGKFFRLQIRTAWYDQASDNYLGNVRNAKTNRKNYSYVKSNTKDVDFFVFVIDSLNIFYIIPSLIIEKIKSTVTFIPHRLRKRDGFGVEKFKNNWDILQMNAGA